MMADRFDSIESKIDNLVDKVSALSVGLATLQSSVQNAIRAAEEWPATDRRLALLESRKPTWDNLAETRIPDLDSKVSKLDTALADLIKDKRERYDREREAAAERRRKTWQIWMAMCSAILALIMPLIKSVLGI